MLDFVYILLFATIGAAIAYFLGIENLENSFWYSTFISTLLAIGLYGSVYGIDQKELLKNKNIVISAVTIGVLAKILIIGGILWFFNGTLVSFLLAVIVAQIDPLSVAALNRPGKLSNKTQTILRAWSSFDDPVTVIAALFIASNILTVNENVQIGGPFSSNYLVDLSLNILFPSIIYCIHRLWHKRFESKDNLRFDQILLLCSFIVAIYSFWMWGFAVIALFLRPKFDFSLDPILRGALWLATVALGILLIREIQIVDGLILAILAIIAQILVSVVLTWRYSLKRDVAYLAAAQQNGITAIILALLFEPSFSGTIAIIAPAIFFINLIYLFLNYFIDVLVDQKDANMSDDPNRSGGWKTWFKFSANPLYFSASKTHVSTADFRLVERTSRRIPSTRHGQ